MTYKEIQDKAVKDFNITIVINSKCYSRTRAHCDGSRRICKWKQAESYKSTFTLFHEIGHIETDIKGMKRCEQESEATKWAINEFRKIGLPIKRKVINAYKDYIRMTYNRGVRRGLKKNWKEMDLLI